MVEQAGVRARLRAMAGALSHWAEESYQLPYRSTIARAQSDSDDLFMMLVLSESLGVPNPMSYYTLELMPVMYERFHAWHQRMGMDRSPLDHLACC